ncbi:hypothetical protein FRB95_003009 [Tulasnella sp. JGI-2019a]|nr:hypothetical protein FRB95_003009 [Tulasnella sp. JGI-2019a]
MSDRSQTPLGSYIDDIYHFGSDHTDHTLADSDLEDSTNKKHETNPRGRFTPVTATRTSSLHPEVVEHPYQLQKDEEIQALFDASLDNIPRSVECRWKACGAKLGSLAILERHLARLHVNVDLDQGPQCEGLADARVWHSCRYGTCSNRSFPTPAELLAHISSHHLAPLRLVCHFPGCNKLQKDHNMLRNHLHTFHGLEDAQLHQLPLSAFHLLPSSLTLLPLPVAQTPTYFVGLPKVSTSKSAKLDTTKSLGYTARDPLVEDILDEDRPFVEEMGRLEPSRKTSVEQESQGWIVALAPLPNGRTNGDKPSQSRDPPSLGLPPAAFASLPVATARSQARDASDFAAVKGLRAFWDFQFSKDPTAPLWPSAQEIWIRTRQLPTASPLFSPPQPDLALKSTVAVIDAPRLNEVPFLIPPIRPQVLPRRVVPQLRWVDNHINESAGVSKDISTGLVEVRETHPENRGLRTAFNGSNSRTSVMGNSLITALVSGVAPIPETSLPTFGFAALARWHMVSSHLNTNDDCNATINVAALTPTLDASTTNIEGKQGTTSGKRKRPRKESSWQDQAPPLALHSPGASKKKSRLTM